MVSVVMPHGRAPQKAKKPEAKSAETGVDDDDEELTTAGSSNGYDNGDDCTTATEA